MNRSIEMTSMLNPNTNLNYKTAFKKLKKINQEHLLSYWEHLCISEKKSLLQQIYELNIKLVKHQKSLFSQPKIKKHYAPITSFTSANNNPLYEQTGYQLLQQKKVGCIVLAGGQGSRLKYDGPKGLFPVSPIKKKTLFQLIAEKVKAASSLVNQELPIAFMLSPLNQKTTITYFKEHNFFGLNPNQIDFFVQPMWPLLDPNYNLFLESPSKIAFGPNGNGCISNCLLNSSIWNKWHKQGIQMVSIIPIDNPLALPFDIQLFGFHRQSKNDVSIKTSFRSTPEENVGILAKSQKTNKTLVIEYSEISEQDRFAKNKDNSLKYSLANIGLYCFSMDFIKKTANKILPIHYVKKSVSALHSTDNTLHAWKFEQFIFDLFNYANKSDILVYPRDECFAPLKNLNGDQSIQTVREALLTRERRLFQQATGIQLAPNTKFELDANFYYSSNASSSHWQKHTFFEESFIEAS